MKQIAGWHLHTSYSYLDGAAKIPELVKRAKELNMPALGMSDHGQLSGAIEFYKECKDNGIKPILGEEFYHTDDRTTKETVKQENENGVIDGSDKRYYHLSVYAKNNEGYHNLLKLSSDAYLNGFWYKPRCDYDSLAEYSEGLIIGSGCLGGAVLQSLLHDNYEQAFKTAARLQDIAGKENFFIELMDHSLPEQHKTNPFLLDIAKKLDAPVLCTMDSHYVNRKDSVAHDSLLCCQTHSKLSDEKRFKFHNDEYYLKSADEMYDRFSYAPEACDNTLVFAEKCDVTIDFNSFHLPVYPDVPEEFKDDSHYLEHLVFTGLEEKYHRNVPQEAYERAAYELSVIKTGGYSSYFLIFWDIANFARRSQVVTGPGRGSAAGALVSWALGITKVNPLDHGLIFERFLNPHRVSPPDVDYDIPRGWRETLINYTRERFGEDRVAQIITFSNIKARTAVRDTARVMGLDYAIGDKIAKAMPPLVMGVDTPLWACIEKTEKYADGYNSAKDLRTLYETDSESRKVIETALGLEGLKRGSGVHAAAVVIGDRPLAELVPLQKSKDGDIITQWDGKTVEKMGLQKMDYLGLKNLDIITDCLHRIGLPVTFLDDLTRDDPATFALLKAGKGIGVFQVESPNMRQLLQRVAPDNIDDISSILALYRPGPMAANMHNDFADRKNGRQAVSYFHPDAKDILEKTRGLPYYQESIMELAQKFAGYTMADADNLRRIIGKKLPDEMALERDKFIDGCLSAGYETKLAEELFNMIEAFSAYSFNGAHSYGYGYITYWTAYLKANYPREYIASLCSFADDLDEVSVYLNEARSMGLHVYPPDMNRSETSYVVEEDGIRIGLSSLKNIGESATDKFIAERNSNGPFTSLYDFAKRLNPNVQAFRSLAFSGALDGFGTRQGIAAVADDVLAATRKETKKNSKDQGSLFDVQHIVDFNIPEIEFPEMELLRKEKETLGIYVSGHPLDSFRDQVTKYTISDIKSLEEQKGSFETLCMISAIKTKYTKAGDAMAIVDVEDQTGSIECVVFPKKWKELKGQFFRDGISFVSVRIGRDFRDERNYVLMDCKSIDNQKQKTVDQIFGIHLPKKYHLDTEYMSKLKGLVLSHTGMYPLKLYTSRSSIIKMSNEYFVDGSDELKEAIKKLFIEFNKKGK